MAETRRNVIITFANQKGGVGKSTLCALFAHYLTLMGRRVTVVDADRQQSLTNQRQMNLKSDVLRKETTTEAPAKSPDKRYVNLLTGALWDVETHAIRDAQDVDAYMRRLRTFEGVVLIDSPGNLAENGIVPLTLWSDIIVTPFFYEMQTLLSTAKYLVFVDKLGKRFPDREKAQVFLLPNRHKVSVGTREEKQRTEQTILALSQYGKVTPDIKDTGRIQHYTTTGFNLKQKEACAGAFDFILKESGLDALFQTWDNTAK